MTAKTPLQQYQQCLYDIAVHGSPTGDADKDIAVVRTIREAAGMTPDMEDVTIRVPVKLAQFLRYDADQHGWKLHQLGLYIAMRMLTAPEVQANLPIGACKTDEDFVALADLFLPVEERDLPAYLKQYFSQ